MNFRLEYMLYFGRYSEEKGIRTLCSACRKLPEISFVFAGRGALADAISGIDNALDIGFQPQDCLTEWIRNARAVIVPSEWYEPFGLTVIEAVSLGVPVIGSDVAGIKEIIKEGNTGALFERGNTGELANIIQKIWNEKSIYNTLKANCLKYRPMTTDGYYLRLMQGIYTGDCVHEDIDYKNRPRRNPS